MGDANESTNDDPEIAGYETLFTLSGWIEIRSTTQPGEWIASNTAAEIQP